MRGRLSRRDWGRGWVRGDHRESEAAARRRTQGNPAEEPRFRRVALQPRRMSRSLHKACHGTFIRLLSARIVGPTPIGLARDSRALAGSSSPAARVELRPFTLRGIVPLVSLYRGSHLRFGPGRSPPSPPLTRVRRLRGILSSEETAACHKAILPPFPA